MAKKCFISLPMAGIDIVTYCKIRDKACYDIVDKGYDAVDPFIEELPPYDIEFTDVWYLSKSLEIMAECNAVYFCKGWENARGCKIEHEVAKNYGLEIIYEE